MGMWRWLDMGKSACLTEDGQSMVEYILLFSVVFLVIIGVVLGVANNVDGIYLRIRDAMQNV